MVLARLLASGNVLLDKDAASTVARLVFVRVRMCQSVSVCVCASVWVYKR